MNTSKDDTPEMALLREVNQRTTRIESRMVQLGDYVGANLRTRLRVELKRDPGGKAYVEIDALDVSLSRIYSMLQEMKINEVVDVTLKGVMVATVYPPNV